MSARPALPISLTVSARRCVVVGDDPAPQRLRDAGARVRSIAPDDYHADALEGAFLVFCFDAARAVQVSADARRAGALFYAPDRPDLSDLAMPAVARRGPIAIAAATDGVAPALARRLREELQRLLDEAADLDGLIDRLERERAELPPGDARRERLRDLAAALTIEGAIRISRSR